MKNLYATRALLCSLSMTTVCQSWAPTTSCLSRQRMIMSGQHSSSFGSTSFSATTKKQRSPRDDEEAASQLEAMSYDNYPEYVKEEGENVGQEDSSYDPKRGDEVQVEVISFGPMGASIQVVAKSHDPEDVLDVDQKPYATGIIFQREIHYFRQRRNNLDVVLGEVLKGYISNVRDDGKLDVSLRPLGRGKVLDWGPIIYQRIREQPDGVLPLGDKSSPDDIAREFPGISKKAFKLAVSALYKRRMVQPGPDFVRYVENEGED